jgi:hypothetical protein
MALSRQHNCEGYPFSPSQNTNIVFYLNTSRLLPPRIVSTITLRRTFPRIIPLTGLRFYLVVPARGAEPAPSNNVRQHVKDVKVYGCLNSRIAKGILSPYYRIRTLNSSEHEPYQLPPPIISTITFPKNLERSIISSLTRLAFQPPRARL